MENVEWSENVILVDGDYIDKVAFDLIVNFERMLMRRIPNADLARWIECASLDGGMKPDSLSDVQVIFIHSHDRMQNFAPSSFADDINGQAFRSALGEVMMTAYPVEPIVAKDDFFLQILDVLKEAKEVKRLILVPDAESYINKVKKMVSAIEDKNITLLSMQPQTGGNFRQEILGYSLMNALGIHADELERL